MKKRIIATACAALMLLTGCGASSGSEASSAPTTGAENMIYENGKESLIDREWKENFVVTREDGTEIPFEVDLVTTCVSEEADSVIEYSNAYDTNENRRKIIEYIHPGCKVFPVGEEYMIKSEIQEIIDVMEEDLATIDWDNQAPDYESKEEFQRRINEYKRLLERAPEVYIDVNEIEDGRRYNVAVDEKVVAQIGFHEFSGFREGELKLYFCYFGLDEKFYFSTAPRQRVEIAKEQEYANNILNIIGAENVDIIPDPKKYGSGDFINNNDGDILVYPGALNVTSSRHFIDVCIYSQEGEEFMDYFAMTPLVVTKKQEHVSLLSFEEAVNAIKSNLDKGAFYKYAQSNIVNKMELGLYPVENEDGGAYVPAWILQDGKLIINAIDGTFIDAIDKK